ncbi:MAG TPA: UDP-glucuronic acid decarboxylase family protein [Actinomycetota bacterium]|nr:UDP-glucuronic acid decarboxylase family protein [Actinomycetota bacterium]
MRVLVAGGAGFLGSHLCERLIAEGNEVLCFDTLLTGSLDNLTSLRGEPRFAFEQIDVTQRLEVSGPLEWIMHLASPASPVDYFGHPIHTLKLGSLATFNCLGLARATGAGFFLASTSEVYGDPLVHPQPESYWGNVNPVGVRSVYDEAKRFAEAATMAYHREHAVPVRIARIFNTYGPRMRRNDGRAIPAFISQALTGQPMTVHGDGSQTRSLCYVDDTIEGFIRLLGSERASGRPVNIGNPEEVTVLQLAERVRSAAGSGSEIVFRERPLDDPQRRCPDPGLARELLGWTPAIPLARGIERTLEWARRAWAPSPEP